MIDVVVWQLWFFQVWVVGEKVRVVIMLCFLFGCMLICYLQRLYRWLMIDRLMFLFCECFVWVFWQFCWNRCLVFFWFSFGLLLMIFMLLVRMCMCMVFFCEYFIVFLIRLFSVIDRVVLGVFIISLWLFLRISFSGLLLSWVWCVLSSCLVICVILLVFCLCLLCDSSSSELIRLVYCCLVCWMCCRCCSILLFSLGWVSSSLVVLWIIVSGVCSLWLMLVLNFWLCCIILVRCEEQLFRVCVNWFILLLGKCGVNGFGLIVLLWQDCSWVVRFDMGFMIFDVDYQFSIIDNRLNISMEISSVCLSCILLCWVWVMLQSRKNYLLLVLCMVSLQVNGLFWLLMLVMLWLLLGSCVYFGCFWWIWLNLFLGNMYVSICLIGRFGLWLGLEQNCCVYLLMLWFIMFLISWFFMWLWVQLVVNVNSVVRQKFNNVNEMMM